MPYEEKFNEALALIDIEGQDEIGDDGIGWHEYHGAWANDSRPYAIRTYEGQVTLTWIVEGDEDLPEETAGFSRQSDDELKCDLEFVPVAGTRKVETDDGGVTRFTCTYDYEGQCHLPDDYGANDYEPDDGPDWCSDWERDYP